MINLVSPDSRQHTHTETTEGIKEMQFLFLSMLQQADKFSFRKE